jgi:GT2 family glycosyltransferase
MQNANVTVVIVNYRTPDLVAINLAALAAERASLPNLSVLVVDGGSGDNSPTKIASSIRDSHWEDWVRLRPLALNGGFGWANNQAIREALREDVRPDFVYLVNPDAVARPGAIQRLIDALQADPHAGAAGSRLLDDDGTVLGSAFRFPSAASEFSRGADTGWINRILRLRPLRIDPAARARVDWVTGASVMFRPEALESAGIFDEGFFLYFEEVELMHRMRRAGWHTLHEPLSEVVHVGGASTGVGGAGAELRALPDYWYQSRLRYFARVYGRVGAFLVNLAWLAGKAVWGLRSLLGKSPAGRQPPQDLAGVWRNGLWPRRHDLAAHGATVDDRRATPAWMEWR